MDDPMLSRRADTDAIKVELRGDISRDVADVLDAVSHARRCSRMELIGEILEAWAEQKRHESMMVVRVTGVDGCRRPLHGRPV